MKWMKMRIKMIQPTPILKGKDAIRFLKDMKHREKYGPTKKEKKFLDECVKTYYSIYDQSRIDEFEKWIIGYFGTKCEDYNKDCCLCQIWKVWDKLKKLVEQGKP